MNRTSANGAALDFFPANPVTVEVWRGSAVESVHRGAWCLVGPDGAVQAAAGEIEAPIFARSTIKSLQALPLLESGAAERLQMGSEEVALAISSHSAESIHTERVAAWLGRLDLDERALLCGKQPPSDPATRAEVAADQRAGGPGPSTLHNNCSGKHAGFLTLARALEVEPAEYLSRFGAVQTPIAQAVAEMCDAGPAEELEFAVDGCSAPTYRLSVRQLALGFARVANPAGLSSERAAACRTMQAAVAEHPELIAGNYKRLCTDLARVTGGRLFPKIGAEGVYCIGVRDSGLGLACKVDDGQARGLHALVLGLLSKFELISAQELERLRAWAPGPLSNWAGLEVGQIEVPLDEVHP